MIFKSIPFEFKKNNEIYLWEENLYDMRYQQLAWHAFYPEKKALRVTIEKVQGETKLNAFILLNGKYITESVKGILNNDYSQFMLTKKMNELIKVKKRSQR